MKQIFSLLIILCSFLAVSAEEITFVYNEGTANRHSITFRTLPDSTGNVEIIGIDFLENVIDELRVPKTVEIDGETYTVTQFANDVSWGYRHGGTKKLIIPNTITKILGSLTDDNLETLIIEDAPIEEIESYAFDGCDNLVKVDFGNACKMKTFPSALFSSCVRLKEIDIPESVEIIRSGAFKNCTSLESIVIPAGVRIVWSAFKDCTTLESVEFKGDYLESMSETFINCTSLKSISLPAVGDLDRTFKDCVNLESVSIANWKDTDWYNMSVGVNAFENCTRLQTFDSNPVALKGVGQGAFQNCTSLKEFSLGPNTSIGAKAFAGCTGLEKFNVVEDEKWDVAHRQATRDGVLIHVYDWDPTINILVAYPTGKRDAHYNVPEDMGSISDGAFEGAVHLESVTIGENVAKLGVMTFRNCPALKKVTLPESIGYIPSGTFMECGSLEEVNLPDNLNYIGIGAFQDCVAIKEVNLPKELQVLGESAFHNCASLEKIDVPAGVTELRPNTFRSCKSMTEISLPSGLENIGRAALEGCSSLGSVNLPESLTGIEERAFNGCASLTEIEIPDATVTIGNNAFDNCTSLKSASTGNGVKDLGAWAFYGCTSLENLTLGSSLQSIGTEAFDGDINIRHITSLAVTPPYYPTGFPQEVVDNAEVNVPEGSENLYNADGTWSPMVNMTGLNDIYEDIADKIKINGNILTVSEPTDVYTLSGMHIGRISDSVTLPDGIYVVKNQSGTVKIMIRR